jgi:CheY-like chemotaxis protein
VFVLQEAVELIRNKGKKFSLVFIDNEMPRMTGPEALKLIKTEYDRLGGHTCRFVGLTGRGGKEGSC